ncbi:NADPH dehydrogenase [Tetrabaena socialis]|uniref:NADPH dehydrogenase n=1 Tax=Tetrabaena socialis TaxID=47790 RepID=A0A2J7ZRM9_9CHLO|nr:NADPH dehydrogenase [Tetrabaena socialis]|eukprot:PNH02923.1 NADPH dehydrogenase [Tetrabaena socialis]
MTPADIEGVVQAFAEAARRAVRAGFQCVEIHMAHGYLLHQFLSPVSNRRNDAYGGSLDNRMRLPLAVAVAVRAAMPPGLPLLVRISATDWGNPLLDGPSWDLPQSVALCRRLREEAGVDLVDVSSGGSLPRGVPVGPGYQVPFADRIRREAGVAVGAVGLITGAAQAEAVLQEGKADAIFIGRELLRDPHWPLRAAAELGYEGDAARYPRQYDRGRFPVASRR